MKRFFFTALKTTIISAICLVVISCSCSNTAGIQGNGDLIAPEISGSNPTEFKTKVPLNTSVSVTFSEPMDLNSINGNTFYIKNASNKNVAAEVYAKGRQAILKPNANLNAFQRYTVTLERNILDLNGNRLAQDNQIVFTTSNEIDNTPPEVTGIVPAENEVAVSINSSISVTFSEDIDYTSVTDKTFWLQNSSGNPVTGKLETTINQIIFTPDSAMEFDTQYLLTLTTGILDVFGNNLTSNFVNYFTTTPPPDVEGPFIVNVYPKNDATNIATNSSISADFNETLGSNVTDSTMFVITDEYNQIISGLISVRDNILLFKPSIDLATKTKYTATLNQAITDLQGNPMEAPFTWQFTTGDGADTEAPYISFVMPENNAIDVANNNAITVTFSETIDPKTIGFTKFNVKANGEYISGSITYSGSTVIFKPKSAMTNSTPHEVTIGSGVSDLAGNLTTENYTWNFTTGTARDTDIPRVSSIYPADGASDFATNSSIIVRFTEAMNPSTLTPKSFYLQDSNNNIVTGTVTTLGASSSFRPLKSLNFAEQYTVYLTTDLEDLADNNLAEIYSWRFTTASAEDTTSPTIISTVPGSGSQQAAANRGVIVSFSEAMDAESINLQSYYLTDTNGVRIPGTIAVTEDTAIYKPLTNLAYSTTYIVNLLTSVSDISGNPLNKVFSWNFTTGSQPDSTPPQVTRTTPLANGLAAVNNKISIQFNEAMNTNSITTATVVLTDSIGNQIKTTVNAAEKNAYIKPLAQLAFDTNYRVTVKTGVKDLANNKMAAEFTLNFKTSLSPDLAPPFVVSTTPFDTENNVHITTIPSVMFSEAIDCSAVTNDYFQILAAGVPVAASINCSVDTLTFLPNSVLATQTDYVLQITTDIVDLSGDNLLEQYQSSFSTAPWTQQTGTPFFEQAYSLSHDSADNIISAGNTTGSFGAINKGEADIFVAKYEKNSLLKWTKQFGSDQEDYVKASVIDSADNIYLTGYTYGDLSGTNKGNSDLFVIKLDANGNLLWQQQLGTAEDDAANALALDNDGNLIVAAYSFADFDEHSTSGQHDIVILKFDSAGNKLWSQQFGSLDNDIPNGVSVDSANNILLTGYTLGDLKLNSNQGDADVFVSKLDSNGNHFWTKTLGSFFDDMAQSIAIESSDNIIITGFTLGGLNGKTNLGSADQFVAKYDNDGALVWYQQIGTALDDRVYDLALNSDDSIVVGGYTSGDMQGANKGSFDIVSHKLDSSGNIIWTTQIGSSKDDFAFAMTLDSDENIYLSGYTTGSLDNIEPTGPQDLIVLKLNSLGQKQ